MNLWERYRKKYGSLNPANRNEFMIAQLTATIAATHGVEATIYDFSPSMDKPVVDFGEALVLMSK